MSSAASEAPTAPPLPWQLTQVPTQNKAEELARLAGSGGGGKLVHFIRHAQGHHNVAGEARYEDYELEEYEDAALSSGGTEQCFKAADTHEELLGDVPLVVVSIMRRCMQTATACFPALVGKEGVQWLANEDCREQTGSHPCDRRHCTTAFKTAYPHVDFSDIVSEEDPLYWKYGNDVREPKDACFERCKVFLAWLSERPEKEVIVCTHSAILAILVSRLIPHEPFKMFKNCELRSYCLSATVPASEGGGHEDGAVGANE